MRTKHTLVWLGALALLPGCLDSRLQKLEQKQVAPPAQTIALKISGYTPAPGYVFQNVFVSNFSVVLQRGALHFSAARDGMYDDLKTRLQPTYGFGLPVPDSNGHGFSDLVLYLAGIPTASQASLVCGSPLGNSSNDAFTYPDTRQPGAPKVLLGLNDCEKTFLQLNPVLFDFDGDGIPDYLEVRNGLNPINGLDANLSPAADGVTNLQKIQRHIPLDESATSQPSALYAYKYATDTDPDTGAQSFTVTNIPVLLDQGAENFIAMYLIENNPSTNSSTLYTAYMLVNHAVPDTLPINIAFWGSDPTKKNNIGLVQP